VAQIYRIVQHEGAWAYEANGAYSERFPTRDLARKAAGRVARSQKSPLSRAEPAMESFSPEKRG
jgi:hypothetical protein